MRKLKFSGIVKIIKEIVNGLNPGVISLSKVRSSR